MTNALKPLFIANWKMYKTVSEAEQYFDTLTKTFSKNKQRDVVICPPFTLLKLASALSKGLYEIGAQDVFWEQEGAFTGEISPKMLQDLGCTYVIVAHSERRKYFGETNASANKKILACLKTNLKPVYCVGETQEEKDNGKTQTILQQQLTEGLKSLSPTQFENISIAYEPVWAIGSGTPDSPLQANTTATFIRQCLEKMTDPKISSSIRILYGGSVKPDNIAGFMSQSEISGALVGGASLDPHSFLQIITEPPRNFSPPVIAV